ncbi:MULTISPECIES: hypothetical protein [unclassified Bradyrhizobium]|uniref:hypothetical protein n=1 Tax=unclassified Bradyrhizobium TaxID=2631580 RepID=UPI001BA8FC6C|nr:MULTISPECIES: hypothetical protein [unclassified Bradyrhizobium]MBR1206741.1 hypothetical protein [Bradyrhizobium sp. AUGA SZCCT0124]MBR1316735.1 hypothetical protein [Bradyrhizobium sp. AUGA SZCCT0051]MBR1344893.1 hypothetical protein [Bradyrhizobium sp. AUGA SZCCT0105]MBR1356311.1 hypothetical protein [Bradyrhizobium sp. AUGA SZCCT0045]
MALIILSNAVQTYSILGSPTLIAADGGPAWQTTISASPTLVQSYTVSTNAIAGVLLIPDPEYVDYLNETGANGVFTLLQYKPFGSIQGSAITVALEVGAFAYYNNLIAANVQFVSTLNAYIANGYSVQNTFDAIEPLVNALLQPNGQSPLAIGSQLANDATELANAGFSALGSEVQVLSQIATEWDTPVYFLNGQPVSAGAIDFGIVQLAINGASTTWAVNGASGGVTVSGFTAVSRWSGDPSSTSGHGYYNILDADTYGSLNVSSFGFAHAGSMPLANLVSGGAASGSGTITLYNIWETGSGGAKVTVNGVVQPNGVTVGLTAAQLAQATYFAGSGSDTFWVQYVYGSVTGSWQPIQITAPVDTPGVVGVAKTATHNQIFSAASLFSYSDTLGSAATQYDFWNTGSGGGYFQLDALAPYAGGQDIIINASQLASLTYTAGSGSDTLWVRAFDGYVWSSWSNAFTVVGPIDTGPVEAVASIQATHGQSFAASTLFSYSDPFGVGATQYDFWDSGTGGGHFVLNGVTLNPNADNIITAAQLSQLVYQSGSGADTLWVRANDGTLWGSWSAAFTVTAPLDSGPVETVANHAAVHAQNYAVSSLFTYSDPFGSAAVAYDVWDSGVTGGHFSLNGVALQAGRDNYITAAQLSSLSYQSGSGIDTLWIRANDGTVWGAWSNAFTISAPIDPGPVEIVQNLNATHGQSYAASSLFTYSDPFGSAATQYDVWDTGGGGGHFVFNGQALQPNGDNIFSAAQLPYLTYQSGSGTDTLWVRANDGTVWGAWSSAFTVNAPIDTGPVVTPVNPTVTSIQGQIYPGSVLFTYSDPFGSAATRYDVWDTGVGGGAFFLNGVALAPNQDNYVSASQLAQLTYKVGSSSDTLWIRAFDGTVWGNWSSPFTVQDPSTIAPGQTLDLPSASAADLYFASDGGTLKLDNSQTFTGTVAGMTGRDAIDFADIAFSKAVVPGYSGDSTGGTLSLTDGTHAANIALLGNYIASTFVASSDGHGGTLVVNQPVSPATVLAAPPHVA